MHPELAALFRSLTDLRVSAGYTAEAVEEKLVMGPGWIERFESGMDEPSFGTLAALLALYGHSLSDFFESLDFGDEAVIVDRHLAAEEVGESLVLHFPMGSHAAEVTIPDASLDEFNQVLLVLRDELASGSAREAIVNCFLKAVELWPHANPSDLWYFLVAHAYQDDFNHPAKSAGKDWAQSWKRAGGWSLEAIFVNHYNKYLATQGIRLDMPAPDEKKRLLGMMGLTSQADLEKSDVLVLGKAPDGSEHPFGVIHVKASFAERRTDDAPLSAKLIRSNYVSPLLTMDCKASPSAKPNNRGELGPVQGGLEKVSSKRLDIEEDRIFDAVFVYNRNSLPTPVGAATAARIYICTFADPDDSFSRHLIKKWKDRQGI
ncbi:transcriptional regulator with XRE-family HTH domain [Rhodococcus percolatus]|uniref:helix-turn-helix domain-containing protein n=1 Tax=Rhodococcus opacus TaxID=37919 RepID=UPI0015FE22C4|nr:helix-turn-helix domain-containing protein [Rhodococcus opacus]MBA8965064.1 transcriptional regulator with XRE-family HTH domain [Rhodococcus opacus]MBP2209637.1 transcriptional regulator with XRE-family HTH domain [Rhodococcus opacus]